MIMKIFLQFLLVACICSSCKEKKIVDNSLALKMEMMETDRAFSSMSETKGLKIAYLEFIDSNGVLLRPNSLPLKGANAMDFISQSNDTAFKMTWEPKSAAIAVSGELGYTFGVYSIKPIQEDTMYYGSYVTIWKKQPGGKWKFTLQSGNHGID